jgi:hypothetical protein|tara:strand:+ start:1045 stop:1347 length:303 start_codon:yes stop_codon:yes gene_type:complete
MELYASPELYERVIHHDEERQLQVRLTVSTFRGIEYIHLRKYFLSFDEEWCPTPDGIAFPMDFTNTRELFSGLVEILSLAESKQIIEEHFSDLIQDLYIK